MSPWTVHTPLIAWGPEFKRATTIRVPAGNIDIAPTVLALEGLSIPDQMQGRPLLECLRSGPDAEKMASETRLTEQTLPGGYRAVIQISSTAGHSYVDKSWRVK